MSEHDKDYIGNSVEFKEGERGSLSCNKANLRSPSLDFNPNKDFVSDDIAIDYLASVLVEIYLHNKHANNTQSSDLLPGSGKKRHS